MPPTPPSITLTADDGTPIARRGAIIGAPVDAAKLPKHVPQAFIAIEDRRFYHHWGVDPRGIGRALALALARTGRTDDLVRLRTLVAERLAAHPGYAFEEYLHGVTSEPGGTARMAYSATGLVFLQLADSPAAAALLA